MIHRYAATAAAAAWLTAAGASAQVAVAPPPYSLVVWGEATVTAPPDAAQLDIAVATRADTARQAAAENARQAARVVDALKAAAGSGSTIATAGYAVSPDYRYPREGAEPQIAGYTATNIVRVETPRLEDVGRILDAAIASGANRVQRLEFVLKNEHAAYTDALGRAAARARAEADALAGALGVKVTRVLTANEEPAAEPRPPRPFATAALAADGAAPTPIDPGTIDVRARVRLTVEFSDRFAP